MIYEALLTIESLDTDRDLNIIVNKKYIIPWSSDDYHNFSHLLQTCILPSSIRKGVAIQYTKFDIPFKYSDNNDIEPSTRTIFDLKLFKH